MFDSAAGAFGAVAIFALIMYILFFAFSIFALIFWIIMIVDAAKRTFPNDNDRLIWILIIVLIGFIGAVVYYFVVKRKPIQNAPTSKSTSTQKKT